MKKSRTKYPTKHDLNKRIENILDFSPNVKIRKLNDGTVKVNEYIIKNVWGEWKCAGNAFYRRKSAVGYALCLLHKDNFTARQVKEADRQLCKVKTDIDVYYYHMQRAKNGKKVTMSNRISADMPLLYEADAQLTRLLKSISV